MLYRSKATFYSYQFLWTTLLGSEAYLFKKWSDIQGRSYGSSSLKTQMDVLKEASHLESVFTRSFEYKSYRYILPVSYNK